LAADALSSGIKRRLRLPPGADAPGLDQLPEAVIPLIVFNVSLGMSVVEIAVVAVVFLAANLGATRLARMLL
jgi:CDP-2,3-bis-(O-geranylgeranyl)-sn-glycerol synthase